MVLVGARYVEFTRWFAVGCHIVLIVPGRVQVRSRESCRNRRTPPGVCILVSGKDGKNSAFSSRERLLLLRLKFIILFFSMIPLE